MKRSTSFLAALAATALAASAARAHGPAGGEAPLDPLPAASFTFEDARHLLMRAGFGGTVEEVERLHRLGLTAMVDWIVDYEKRPDIVGPLWVPPVERPPFAEIRRMSEQDRRRVFRELRRQDQQRFAGVRRWWVDRMVRTRRPLEEKMTLFWHGHFTTSYREVRSSRLIYRQNALLRANATGNFGDLLHAISKDPAMLAYLNNNQNRKGRPNENYAREVMELFTLGLGNYTEKDIKEAARAFTGWTFDRRSGRFFFNWRQHDTGSKTIFGKTGNFDGDDVCDLLLENGACAPYIAGKLFAWFAYPGVEPEIRESLGRYLRSCNYEIKPLLRKIFMSRAFYSKKAKGTMVKSPTVLLVSTVRMLGMNPPPADVVLYGTQRLGQALLLPPNVKGWEGGVSWITTATLLERDNICGALIKAGQRGRRPGPRGGTDMNPRRRAAARAYNRYQRWDPGFRAAALAQVIEPKTAADLVDGFCRRLLFVPLADKTRQDLIRFVAGGAGKPPLDVRRLGGQATEARLRELIHLIMSTPEFQVG